MKRSDLEKEVDRLNEELSKRGKGRERTSTYFILLNSNESPKNETQVESGRAYMTEIVQYLGDNMKDVIEFRDSSHEYSSEYVQDINIKFSLEQSRGRKKKDGTYSDYAGQVHAHILVTIRHKSNIKISYAGLQELLQPKFEEYFGHNGFIGIPKWIPDQMVEQYMTKSKDYKYGHSWKSIQ